MELREKIFRAYDIRGIYPEELNEKVATMVGENLAEVFGSEQVVVGRDMRLSSDSLFKSLSSGLTSRGTDVVDLGLVPIDAVYYAVNNLGYKAGIMITASHNPAKYNGIKVLKRGEGAMSGRDILNLINKNINSGGSRFGSVSKLDIWGKYIDHIFSFVDVNKIKSLKVVVDAGNGMAGKVIPIIESRLPIKITPLFFDLDGSFPNHPSNPLELKSREAISEKIIDEQADCGFIFDGDTDRVFVVDERGEFLGADVSLLLLAKFFLNREPGAAIVYNLVCSRIVPEKIEEWGGQPIRSAVGYINISRNLRKYKAVMGGEVSAHYSFRDNGYCDSGFIAFLIILEIISKFNSKLSVAVAPYRKYYKSDEINFETLSPPQEIISGLKNIYQDGKQDELDGLTVEYDSWWFNARPSNTEPLLRLTIESKDKKEFEKKKGELEKNINKLDTD